jgi:hypothetical protein
MLPPLTSHLRLSIINPDRKKIPFMSDNFENREKKNLRPLWTRWLDVLLRTAHVGAMSVLFGAAVCGVGFCNLFMWHNLTIATGSALVASEIYHSRHWFYQGRGIMALTHIGLLGLIHLHPELMTSVLTAVLAFGMVGSHMPKSFRYWSFVHGRVME